MFHWILLLAVIVVVGGAYWYLRKYNGSDPWQGMDDDNSDEEVTTRGQALGGDSYIVGVRTIGGDRADADDVGVAAGTGAASEFDAEAAWAAYKKTPDTAPAPTAPTLEPEPQPQPQPQSAPPPSRKPQLASTRIEPAPQQPTAAARVDNIRPVRPPAGEEKIFMLHVASREGTAFDGPDIHTALDAEGLKFGLNDFYHRVTDDNGEIESVYSVASMVKPGVLDPVDQDHLRTPGLTMFLILPGAIEGLRAMRDMMETANAIAKRLGGQVLDDQRNLLKAQTAQYILDQIAELDRQARLRQAR